MNEMEKKIINTFIQIFPKMSKQEQENLLAYGEGMAVMAERRADFYKGDGVGQATERIH